MSYEKPLPAIDNWNRPFWEATREQRLIAQGCDACGTVFFPPGPVCARCMSSALSWRTLSGRGTVESWVVFHQLYYKGFKEDLPYNVAMIRLEEGAYLLSNVVDVSNDALRDGLPVEVTFEPATDEIAIPKFRATGGAGNV
jgi:uncharacterized OB-fold protein